MNVEPLLLYPNQAQKLLGIRSTKFYELSKLPNFPIPKKPNGKRVMYLTQELIDWARSIT